MTVLKKMVFSLYFLSTLFLFHTVTCSYSEEEALRMWRLNSLSYCDNETLQVESLTLVIFLEFVL